MLRSIRFALASPLLLVLAACGGSASAGGDPYEQGLELAKAGNHAAALASYDQALAALAEDSDEYGEVRLARIESLVHVNSTDAQANFIDFANEQPALVTADDYMRVFGWVFEAKDYVGAGNVAKAFKSAHEDRQDLSEKMDARINDALARAEMSDEEREVLRGLGYLGGQD